ncbi:hypothetical protein [Brevibacillus brevis]|uniref:hypothetical protein n=1 Tax=Brevibacillus brevis TaxID=1393 RepID=UPI0021AD7AC6|nr:hypothetical protein [Brevibacillus brevis]
MNHFPFLIFRRGDVAEQAVKFIRQRESPHIKGRDFFIDGIVMIEIVTAKVMIVRSRTNWQRNILMGSIRLLGVFQDFVNAIAYHEQGSLVVVFLRIDLLVDPPFQATVHVPKRFAATNLGIPIFVPDKLFNHLIDHAFERVEINRLPTTNLTLAGIAQKWILIPSVTILCARAIGAVRIVRMIRVECALYQRGAHFSECDVAH